MTSPFSGSLYFSSPSFSRDPLIFDPSLLLGLVLNALAVVPDICLFSSFLVFPKRHCFSICISGIFLFPCLSARLFLSPHTLKDFLRPFLQIYFFFPFGLVFLLRLARGTFPELHYPPFPSFEPLLKIPPPPHGRLPFSGSSITFFFWKKVFFLNFSSPFPSPVISLFSAPRAPPSGSLVSVSFPPLWAAQLSLHPQSLGPPPRESYFLIFFLFPLLSALGCPTFAGRRRQFGPFPLFARE